MHRSPGEDGIPHSLVPGDRQRGPVMSCQNTTKRNSKILELQNTKKRQTYVILAFKIDESEGG